MELAFVISADRGVMIDERTGKPTPWANCHYLTDYREDSPDATGFKPIKAPVAPEAFDVIHLNGVGLYKLEFRTRPGAMSKPTLTLIKAEHVGSLDVFELGNYRKPVPQAQPNTVPAGQIKAA